MDNQTIHCPNCGAVNTLTAKFCGNCGFDLTAVIAQAKADMAPAQPAVDPNKTAYQEAMANLEGGKLELAVQGFRALGGYADAPDQLEKAMARLNEQEAARRKANYAAATDAFAQGNLNEAARLFEQLGGYEDADAKLKLVRKAQTAEVQAAQQASAEQSARLAAQEYDNNYHQALRSAEQAQTTTELKRYIDYLQQFASYQDGAEQLAKLNQRYTQLAGQEQIKKAANAKTGRLIAIIAAIVIVIGAGGWFAYSHHQSAADALQKQVVAQRDTNAKSYNKLDSKTRSNIKTMFATYHANPKDYTYKVKSTTADYTVIAYSFRGPDKTKDILPSTGTRVYGQVALYRQ